MRISTLVLIISCLTLPALAQSDPLGGFLGTFKAACTGTGPNGLKGQWNWTLTAEHANEDDQPDNQSVSVYESSSNQDHVWLVTFMHPNQKSVEEVEAEVNVTRFQSLLTAANLRQTLRGNVDSFAYSDSSRKSVLYQAHWKSSLEWDVLTGTFQLDYKGYDPQDDPDYSFSCQLARGP